MIKTPPRCVAHKLAGRGLLGAAIAGALSGPVSAFSVVENDQWSVRWDNTFKYQAVFRTESPDEQIWQTAPSGAPRQPLFGEGTRSFDRRDLGLISNRLDWRTELDAIWKNTLGFRVSAAAWYDHVYNQDNDFPQSLGDRPAMWNGLSYGPGEFNDDTQKWHGNHSELLDAFVVANWSIGDVYGNVRLGRHTVFYGNALLATGASHSVAGAMTQVDVAKGLGSPGTEAKELFMPSNKISTVIQLTPNLTLNAFYGLEWQRNRSARPGSFWAVANGFSDDNEFIGLFPQTPFGRVGVTQVDANEPDDRGSNYGLSLQYYFEDADMEVALHYVKTTKFQENNLVGDIDFRKFASLNPAFAGLVSGWQALGLATAEEVTPTPLISDSGPAASIGTSQWTFAEDIDVFGLSFAKEIGGISFGLDLNYHRNTSLRADLNRMLFRFNNIPDHPAFAAVYSGIEAAIGFPVDPANNFDSSLVAPDKTLNPRGDVYTAVLNGVGFLNDNGIWEGGSYLFEVTLSYLDDITQNEYYATQGDAQINEGRLSSHGVFIFRPTWYQVLPGVDLTTPISINYGIDGNSALTAGFNNQGVLGVGASLNIQNQWTIGLKYTNRFGSVDNSLTGLLKDRDNIALTVKATF